MNNFIKVSYSLYAIADDGKQELMERVPEDKPFQFISGMDMALESFEKQVESIESGNEFNFTLTPDEAHGPYEADRVVDLDKKVFCVDGHFDSQNIFPGAIIPLINEDGNHFHGIIMEIGDDSVKVDLNHPLAGKTLLFKGKVLENREATNKEIEGYINMMSSEGCDCGCGDDCHCDHHHNDGECGCGEGNCKHHH